MTNHFSFPVGTSRASLLADGSWIIEGKDHSQLVALLAGLQTEDSPKKVTKGKAKKTGRRKKADPTGDQLEMVASFLKKIPSEGERILAKDVAKGLGLKVPGGLKRLHSAMRACGVNIETTLIKSQTASGSAYRRGPGFAEACALLAVKAPILAVPTTNVTEAVAVGPD